MLSPAQIMERLEQLEVDIADRSFRMETEAEAWFRAKREREKEHASAFIEAKAQGMTVAEATAVADRDTALLGLDHEARYEALRAVLRTLETRASIGQSLLRAHSAAGAQVAPGPQPAWSRGEAHVSEGQGA